MKIINFKNKPRNCENFTLEEIGWMMDLSKERVRQIETKSLSKAGKILQSRRLISKNFLGD